MHDIMVACQEIEFADVEEYRRGGEMEATPQLRTCRDRGSDASCGVLVTVPAECPSIPSLGRRIVEEDLGRVLLVLKWITKLTDQSSLLALANTLPDQILREQIRMYDADVAGASPAVAGKRIYVLQDS